MTRESRELTFERGRAEHPARRVKHPTHLSPITTDRSRTARFMRFPSFPNLNPRDPGTRDCFLLFLLAEVGKIDASRLLEAGLEGERAS